MFFICFSQLVPWMRQEGVTLKSVSNPGITIRFHHSTMEPTTQQLPSPSTGSYVLWVNVFPVLTICGTVHNYLHWDGDNFLVSSELKYLHSRDSSRTKKICRAYVPHLDPSFVRPLALTGTEPELLWAQWEAWDHTAKFHPHRGCVAVVTWPTPQTPHFPSLVSSGIILALSTVYGHASSLKPEWNSRAWQIHLLLISCHCIIFVFIATVLSLSGIHLHDLLH